MAAGATRAQRSARPSARRPQRDRRRAHGRDLAARPVRDGPDLPLRRRARRHHRRARRDGRGRHAAPGAARLRRAPHRAAADPRSAAPLGRFAARWSRAVQRRPWTAAMAGAAVLLALAAPAAGLRLGYPDAGNDRAETTTRQAFELMTRTSGRARTGRSGRGAPAARRRARRRAARGEPGDRLGRPPRSTPPATRR